MSTFSLYKSEKDMNAALCQMISGKTALEIIQIAKLMEDKNSSSQESSTPEEQIREIRNWYIKGIWNDGIIDISHYLYDGKSGTGGDIDIEFTIRNYNKSISMLDEYNQYIEGLNSKEYEDVKYAWNKIYGEIVKINNWIQNNEIQANYKGERFSTDLLTQYFDYFDDIIDEIEAKRDINK